MGSFIVYLLEWSACLLAFLLLYKMCFSGTTFHRFNRFYLLSIVVLSAMLPLIHIVPSTQMEPMAEVCRTVVQIDGGHDAVGNLFVKFQVASAEDTERLTTIEKAALALLAMYVLYGLIQLIGWSKSIIKMLRFIHGKRRHRIGRWAWLVEHDANYGPFSWMNCIVISTHEQGFGRKASIRHELAHIALLHHCDLVLLMLCIIVNPVCWIVMKELKIVHEYEADDEVINHYRILSRDYQRLLVMRTVGAEAYALASSFNLNIKKRIMMMKKKQSHWWRMLWIAVTLPLIGFSLMAFSKPKDALKEAVNNTVRIIEQPIAEVLTAETPQVPVTSVVTKPQQKELQSDEKPGDVVTGIVSNENGQPLQLANVVEEDSYHRIVANTVTDKDGRFSLKVSNPQNKIRITYVGYQGKTLDVGDKQMDVVLKAYMKIKDIRVVGRADSIDLNSPRYQEQTTDDEDDNTFNLVEQAPSFPGGYGELMNYLSDNLRYPSVAREMRVEAEILIQFTVDKTGFVRLPQAISTSSQTPLITQETTDAAKEGDKDALEATRNYYDAVEALKEEAIHVVRSMPRWEPGRQNGKRVETTYTLPINFKLTP